jgi:enoyl-CoA hydratase
MTELVHYAVADAIATITLDSPGNRNALSAQLVGELGSHLAAARSDDAVRAVVLTHTGSTFCAGADLKESVAEGGPATGMGRMRELLQAVVELPKPVIAVLDGHVRAGGIGLVGACDIALAGPATSFAFTEVRIGVAPAIISLTTLARMAPRAVSRYYLTGETFGAPLAAAAGLITAAVDDTATAVAELAAELRLCSPQGLAETKTLTTGPVRADLAARGEQALAQSVRLFGSPDGQEGMHAFLEHRPPSWVTT